MDELQLQDLEQKLLAAYQGVIELKNRIRALNRHAMNGCDGTNAIIDRNRGPQYDASMPRKDGEEEAAERTGELIKTNERLNKEILESRQSERELCKRNEFLEVMVRRSKKELEDTTADLQETIATLKRTQGQLIESERHAVLGNLVSGIAHELNTPLGIGVTIASFIMEKFKEMEHEYRTALIRRSSFETFLSTMHDSMNTLQSNLNKTVYLINSFKQITADHYQGQRGRFNIRNLIEGIASTFLPMYKESNCTVRINCPVDLILDSYPGTYSQIITNLLLYSLNHTINEMKGGEIVFDIAKEQGYLLMLYTDNGNYTLKDKIKEIFNPFHGTRDGASGTSNLGMHVIFNLITKILNGTIYCLRKQQGITFMIQIPFQETTQQQQ